MAKKKVDKGTRQDCLSIGEAALASFTRDELQNFVNEVMQRAESYQDIKGQAAIDRAIDELSNESAKALFDDCKITANNVEKVSRLRELIENKKIDMRQLMTPRGKGNQSNNIWESQRAAKGKLADSFFRDMTSEEQNYLFDPKNTMDIASAMDGATASDMGKSIAEKMKRYIETRNAESVRTDALAARFISDYRYLDHFHDPSAMINGGKNVIQRAMNLLKGVKDTISDPKQAWVGFIKQHLDPENPIAGANVKDDAERLHSILEGIYDNIVEGRNRVSTSSIVVNDLEAIRKKQLLKLNFKDWRSFSEYNQKYGHGNLVGALIADIQGSGSRIGMADMLGSSPRHAYLDLAKAQEKAGIPGRLPSPGLYFRNTDYIFQSLTGMNQRSVAPKVTNFFANLRALTSTVRLLKLGALSTPDIAHGVAYLGRFGNDFFQDFGYYLTNLWNNPVGNLVFSDRKMIAKQFKMMVDSHLGYVARMIDSNNAGQMMNRFTSGIFKITLLDALDKGNKVSTLHLMAKTLGRHSETAWERLPEDFRTQLANHNLTEPEWNLLRQKTQGKLFTLDNVEGLSDAELRSLGGDTPLLNRRSDLYRKVYALFDNAAQQVVLSPTAWTRGMLYGGTSPGTLHGEFVRTVTQFKMYPVDYIDRVWAQGLRNADGMYAKLAFATRLLGATLPLSYLSVWFDYASQGKTMPDPQYMSAAQKLRFYMSIAMPGTGMFLGVMDPRNQNRDLLWSTLRSPSAALIGDSLSTLLAASTGDFKKAKKELGNVGRALTPIDTIPGISPLLREALGDKPYLQPGQRQIYGA